MITLRPYQSECIESIERQYLKGIHRQIVSLPTGAGKTCVFGSYISQTIQQDPATRALVLAFNCELLQQAKDKISMINPELNVGLLDATHKDFDKPILVSSVQSARQPGNLERLKEFGFSLCIADECHHFASLSARHVLYNLGFSKEACEKEGRLLIGFSATPFRQGPLQLAEVFDEIVYKKTIKEMIDAGYLCPPTGFKIATDLDLSSVSIENGDYSASSLSQIMNTDSINQLVVNSYLEKAAGQKTICFATSIDHAVTLAEWFKKYGVRAEAIHSQVSSDEREILFKRYSDGDLEVLVNPILLTEGIDLPITSCVVIVRPTKSIGLFQQMVGRGLRLFPNKKECIVLDFGDSERTLCSVDLLIEDGKRNSEKKRVAKDGIVDTLPRDLNPKLKSAIVNLDLLSDSFTWQKDPADGCYFVKGASGLLKIVKRKEDRYDAVFYGAKSAETIASNLDFSYAFSAAEDFCKAKKNLFAISDLQAKWRELPISDKQKGLLHSYGFKKGIESLTRGQASTIIQSGVLGRK